MKRFNLDVCKPGMILQRKAPGKFSNLICAALSTPERKCEWSHDSIFIRSPTDMLVIGDSVHPRSRLSTLECYEKGMNEYGWKVRVMEPVGFTECDGLWASHWWRLYVLGKPYDWMAYPRLLWKALMVRVGREWAAEYGWGCFQHWAQRQAGLEWAWYCSEGCRDAWHKGDTLQPWGEKMNPTPYTTQKRTEQGHFIVRDDALIESD